MFEQSESVFKDILTQLNQQLVNCLANRDATEVATLSTALSELFADLGLYTQQFRHHIDAIAALLHGAGELFLHVQAYDSLRMLFHQTVHIYHQAQPPTSDGFFDPFVVIIEQLFNQEYYDTTHALLQPSFGLLERYVNPQQRALLCTLLGVSEVKLGDYHLAAFYLSQAGRLTSADLPHYQMALNYLNALPLHFVNSIVADLSSYQIDAAKTDLNSFVTFLQQIEADGDQYWHMGELTQAESCYLRIREILQTEKATYSDHNIPEEVLTAVANYIPKLRSVKDSKPTSFAQIAEQLPMRVDHRWQSLKETLTNTRVSQSAAEPLPLSSIRKGFQERLQSFISQLFDTVIHYLGPPPCQFAILRMGSMRHGLACAYSDFEYALIFDETTAAAKWQPLVNLYFDHFVKLVDLLVISLGETAGLSDLPEGAFSDSPIGFRLDDKLVPQRSTLALCGSIADLSAHLQPTTGDRFSHCLSADGIVCYNLLDAQWFYGDERLAERYYQAVITQVIQPSSQDEHWYQTLSLCLPQVRAAFELPEHLAERTYFSVKDTLIVPIITGVTVLRWYYHEQLVAHAEIDIKRLFSADSEAWIELLTLAGIITPDVSKVLQFTLNFAWNLRQRVHLSKQTESENVTINQTTIENRGLNPNNAPLVLMDKDRTQLVWLYQNFIQPWAACLKDFCEVNNPRSQFPTTIFSFAEQVEYYKNQIVDDVNTPIPPQLITSLEVKLFGLVHRGVDMDQYSDCYQQLPQHKLLRRLFIEQLRILPWKDKNVAPERSVIIRQLQQINHADGWRPSLKNEFFNWQRKKAQCFERLNEHLQQKHLTAGDVAITLPNANVGLSHGILYPEITAQLFDEQGDFRRTEPYGTRRVARIEIGSTRLHFKENPELPGMEAAASLLVRRLFGFGAPLNTLAKIEQPGKPAYPVLISETVTGENLQDRLAADGNYFESLDPQYYSQMILAALLLNQEDGQPANFIIQSAQGNQPERLICIDNDHAFVEAVIVSQKMKLLVKNILFCSDRLKESIDPQAREQFLSLDPQAVLKAWLDDVIRCNERYCQLFAGQLEMTERANKSRFNFWHGKTSNQVIIPVVIREGLIEILYRKMTQFQQLLQQQGDISHLGLLQAVEPLLGRAYRDVLLKPITPFERFELLAGNQYKIVKGVRQTKVNATQYLQSALLEIPDIEAIAARSAYTPEQAMIALENTIVSAEQILAERDALLSGQIARFRSLNNTVKEQVINGRTDVFGHELIGPLKLAGLSATEQRHVLAGLIGTSCYQLDLSDCELLTDKILGKILRNQSELRRLNISRCTQLTKTVFTTIANLCFRLEVLVANNLPLVDEICSRGYFGSKSTIKFILLRRIELNYNKKLESIHIVAPELEELIAEHSQLVQVDLMSNGSLTLNIPKTTLSNKIRENLYNNYPEIQVHSQMKKTPETNIAQGIEVDKNEKLKIIFTSRYIGRFDNINKLLNDNRRDSDAPYGLDFSGVNVNDINNINYRLSIAYLAEQKGYDQLIVRSGLRAELVIFHFNTDWGARPDDIKIFRRRNWIADQGYLNANKLLLGSGLKGNYHMDNLEEILAFKEEASIEHMIYLPRKITDEECFYIRRQILAIIINDKQMLKESQQAVGMEDGMLPRSSITANNQTSVTTAATTTATTTTLESTAALLSTSGHFSLANQTDNYEVIDTKSTPSMKE